MVEELVPTFDFRYKDLVSSGLGTLLGMCWGYRYDSLWRAQGSAPSRLGRWRRRRRRATRLGPGAVVPPGRS
jgi:hypothetical protein